MKRSILITSTDLMMVQFLVPHVKYLSKQGYYIDIACSNVGGRLDEVRRILSPYVGIVHELFLKRSPLAISNYVGYKQLKKILSHRSYDYIWTNEPVMSVVTRLASQRYRKQGMKVMYMAHGFHFYRGAPLLNWCLYYPIEKIMAHYTDMITCVNHEDYSRAKKFKVNKVQYIHGIGINTDRLTNHGEKKPSIREELGLSDNECLILSVGELNKNKNQIAILRALACLRDPKVHYLLCGKGKNESDLKQKAEVLGISSQVHFLGYRHDVVDICSQADIYVMPSFREGLPISSLEAMYCGLPLITSNIRGLIDVNKENINGYLCRPCDYKAFADQINFLCKNPEIRNRIGKQNKKDVLPYTISKTLIEVEKLFSFI